MERLCLRLRPAGLVAFWEPMHGVDELRCSWLVDLVTMGLGTISSCRGVDLGGAETGVLLPDRSGLLVTMAGNILLRRRASLGGWLCTGPWVEVRQGSMGKSQLESL